MLFSSLAAASLSLPLAFVQAAAISQPYPLTAQAFVYSDPAVGGDIYAYFQIIGYVDGTPTKIIANISRGLTENANAPYLYHIHTNPISPDGDCNSALGHLDPLNVTESITCDVNFPQYCQEGDLSGKHGMIKGTKSGVVPKFSYSDDYVRFFPADFSVLGRSIVIHSHNKTRLACGNITSALDGTATPAGFPHNTSSTFVKSYPSAAPYNPVMTFTPFVGTKLNMTAEEFSTYPLPNPLIAVTKNTLFTKFETAPTKKYFNHTTQTVTLPKQVTTASYSLPFPTKYSS